MTGPYGASAPDGQAPPRRTVHGAARSATRAVASSRNRVTPTPAVPPTISDRERPPATSSRTDASRANATSRPTNRALVYLPGMAAF